MTCSIDWFDHRVYVSDSTANRSLDSGPSHLMWSSRSMAFVILLCRLYVTELKRASLQKYPSRRAGTITKMRPIRRGLHTKPWRISALLALAGVCKLNRALRLNRTSSLRSGWSALDMISLQQACLRCITQIKLDQCARFEAPKIYVGQSWPEVSFFMPASSSFIRVAFPIYATSQTLCIQRNCFALRELLLFKLSSRKSWFW